MRSAVLRKILTLLFFSFSLNAFGQTSADRYEDSLLQVIKGSSADTLRLHATMHLYRYYFNHGDFRSSLIYCKRALQLATDLGEVQRIPRITYGIGLNHTQLIHYDSARMYLEKTEELLKEVRDPLLRIQCYHTQGMLRS